MLQVRLLVGESRLLFNSLCEPLIDAAVATGKLDKRSRARADTSRHPNLFCIAVSVVSSSTLDHLTIQRLSFLLGAAGVVALLAAFWIWWRRNVYRRELPRVFELRDLVGQSLSPDAYFQSFEQSLSEIPQKLKQFRDIERDLQGLDADAWTFLKGEVAPLLAAKTFKARLAIAVRQAQPGQGVQLSEECWISKYPLRSAVRCQGSANARFAS
jgi:hypothetical protein